MSNHLNNTLPIEVLRIIFQNLIGKRRTCSNYASDYWKEFLADKSKIHIRTCSSVCKSWQVAAQELFGEMSIRVSEDSLERLSKDIVFFGHKVKSIRLVRIRRRYDVNDTPICLVDRTVTCLIWLDIILACPNLTSIKIYTTDDSNYVRCLMDTTTERLSHIQIFAARNSQLHFQLNLKYCKSITSLCIPSVRWNSRSDGDNSLIYFISLFPKLTYFRIYNKVSFEDAEDVIDIIQLLEAAPQLQKLRASKVKEIRSSSIVTSENLCLTELRLTAREMDIASLIFITNRLKKLNQLYISIYKLITAAPHEGFGLQKEFNAEEFLDDIKFFISSIPQFSIKYEHENVLYTLENGKEPEIISLNNYDDYDYPENHSDIFDDLW